MGVDESQHRRCGMFGSRGQSWWGRGARAPEKQALYTEASNLFKQQEFSRALELFSRLKAAYPTSSRALRGSALCKLAKSDMHGAKEDIERWIACLDARGQSDADAYFHLGECLRGLGDQDGALASMRKAVAINPLHTRALKALGRT